MCRLFATLSTKPANAPYFLLKAPQSLLHQSRVNPKKVQADGWGAGWFENGAPQVRKSPKAIFDDRALLQRVARQAKGPSLVGHIRWASNPMKLPHEDLIGVPHTQPFVHGKWIFAHNGTLNIPKEVKAELGPWAAYIQGKNDSEVLFYWLMKFFSVLLKPGTATLTAEAAARVVRTALTELDDIWQTCRETYPNFRTPYHGLNCVLSDGTALIAWCLVTPGGFDTAQALENPDQPYFQLQRYVTSKAVAVASEPMDPSEPWQPFEHGELLVAVRDEKSVRCETSSLRLTSTPAS